MSASPQKTRQFSTSALIKPLPTPRWGAQSGSAFTVRATNNINAPPDRVLDTLLMTDEYPKWNNFVPCVVILTSSAERHGTHGRLREGVTFTEHVDMFGRGRPSGVVRMRLLMTTEKDLEDGNSGYRVVWQGKGYPDWALRSERVHEIIKGEDRGTVYDVWETFSGPLAALVKLCVGKVLVKRFGQWNEELKVFVESSVDGRIDGEIDTKL